MRRLHPLAFLALLVAPLRADEPSPDPRVLEHDLVAHFTPAAHRVEAEDRVSVEASAAGSLVLDLAPTLQVVEAQVGTASPAKPDRAADGTFRVDLPAGASTVRVRYEGTIFDAVQKEADLSWVVGDATTGLISEKGIFLSDSSRWIPRPRSPGLAHYHLTSYVPTPFSVVTQGSVPERSEKDGVRKAACRSVLPTDGLALVAGPWTEKAKEVEGVRVATWFLEGEVGESDLWLDAAVAVVKRYAGILGKYPHPKFDVVENFFQTGYGMPAYTLLGDDVIRYVSATAKRQGGKIPPGYLDHEYVHGWYGNGLFVDYPTGNWCEALTTYMSNYLAKELESKTEGRAHRRGVLEKFSMRVHGKHDYPLRRFQNKTEDADNDVGYGKGSMLFHMARRAMGDEPFFAALREFTQSRVGTVVSWDDWLAAFSKASGQDMKAHLGPFLERKGLPQVELDDVRTTTSADGSTLSFTVRQLPAEDGGGPWPLFLPIRVDTATGTFDEVFDLSSGSGSLRTSFDAPVHAVVLDPDYDVLRKIAEADLPPCLNRTIEAPGGVVVWRGAESALKPVADSVAKQKGLRIVGPGEAFDVDAYDGPVLVLEVAAEGASPVTVGGKAWSDPAVAVLRSTADGKRLRTRYTAFSEAAAARARYVTFYGWDPWVVFQNGRPVDRDSRQVENVSTRRVLANAASPAGARIRADVDRLAAADFEGRRPGTPGHEKAREWIEILIPAGLERIEQPGFPVGIAKRLSSRDIVVEKDGKEVERWKDAFRPLPWDGPLREVVLTEEGRPWFDALGQRWDAIVRQRSPIVLAADEEAARTFAAWLDTPEDLSEASKAEIAKPGHGGGARATPPLGPWISGRRLRSPAVPPLPSPTIVVTRETATKMLAEVTSGATLRYSVQFETIPKDAGRNLVVLLPPTASAERSQVVVLSAHFDAQGKDVGGMYLGADDNGSGVACLLEVLRGLPEEWAAKKDRKVGLLVCFFDGEEWGLLGSRAFVANKGDLDVRAVVNVDAIGRATTKPTHIVGLSTHADLSAKVRVRLEEAGVSLGKDIDQYAYEEGSDHWPFHKAGIPAVTVWASDYATMNTPEDTPEKVEPEGVAKIAAALRRFVLEDLDG